MITMDGVMQAPVVRTRIDQAVLNTEAGRFPIVMIFWGRSPGKN